MAETNTNNLIPLGNWRDVGGGLTLAVVAGLFPTLFIFLGNWGKLHWSWKSAMGLAFIFGVPGLVAASGLSRAWWREWWYVTPDGAVVVWRRRRWSGTHEERFPVGKRIFRVSREIGTVGFSSYWQLRVTMCSADGTDRLNICCDREESGTAQRVMSTLVGCGIPVWDATSPNYPPVATAHGQRLVLP